MLPPDHLPPARHRVRPTPPSIVDNLSVETSGSSNRPYEVGYGKPPAHSRFQPGRSGNPKGRPKGAKNLNTLVLGVLEQRIAVNTSTGRRKVMRIEAMLHKLVEQGGKGNMRALELLLRQYGAAKAATLPLAEAAADYSADITQADEVTLALLKELFVSEDQAGLGGAS